jgi:hypothetical protein
MKRQVYNGPKTMEAKADLYLVVNERDVALAVRMDPTKCALAQCARRTLKSRAPVFLRKIAYVDVNGVWMRFLLPAATQRLIAKLDKYGPKSVVGGVFVLKAVTPGRTREAQRRAVKKHYQKTGRVNSKPRPIRPGEMHHLRSGSVQHIPHSI